MEESKRDKFVRLAENRMNNMLKQIELLSNLSNTRAYEYEQSDIDTMIKTLKNAISDLKHVFSSEKKNKKFTLKK